MRNKEIRKLSIAAMFVAYAIVLKMFAFNIPGWRISLFPIPLILVGYFLGPIYGLMSGFVLDTAYIMISPLASFWSLFTIPGMLWGLCGAFIKKVKGKYAIVLIVLLITFTSISETAINTLQMYLLEQDINTYLISRIITMFVRLPFLIVITMILIKRLNYLKLELGE